MYATDVTKIVRKSHDSQAVKQIYDEFLGEPLGKKAHKLLHTHFRDKSILSD